MVGLELGLLGERAGANTKDQIQRGLHLSVWLVEKGLYHTYGQVESKLNGE